MLTIHKNRQLHIPEYCNLTTSIFRVKLPIMNMKTGSYPETMVSNTLHGAASKDGRRNFAYKVNFGFA